MINLQEIKEKAEAATPGPWVQGSVSGQCKMKHLHHRDICRYEYKIRNDDEYARRCISIAPNITLIGYDDYGPVLRENNAAYITAVNPQTALKLLRIIEVQKKAIQDILDEAQAICFDHTYVGSRANSALEQVSKILTEQNEGD